MSAGSGTGCLMYFFAICLGIMGYMPFGLHGTDFSKDSKKVVYAYNNKEVRIYDLEKHAPSAPIYTPPKGYVVDTVHRNAATDDIYAVAHNYSVCDASDKEDGTDNKVDRQWNVDIVRLDLAGSAPKTLVHRTFYCPASEGPTDIGGGATPTTPMNVHASYQKNLMKEGVTFKPVGWENGELIYVEPEELTHKPAAVVTKLNLSTGATEKMFTLPDNASSAILSPGGRYLAYMLSQDKDEPAFNLVLRDMKSGVDLFNTMLVTGAPDKKPTEKEDEMDPDTIQTLLMTIGLFSGAEGVTGFDELNNKFFFLTYDLSKKKTSLNVYDIDAKTKSKLFESYLIAAPIAIPQRKALLVNALDISSLESSDKKGGLAGLAMPEFDMESGKTSALMSYDGKIIKNIDAPPALLPISALHPPDYAISADGNLITFTFDDQTNTGDKDQQPKEPGQPAEEKQTAGSGFSISVKPSAILPAVFDLEHGTFQVLITKPFDNFAAGVNLFKSHEYKLARPYLEQYMKAFKPGDPGYRRVAFSLFAVYQGLGMQKEQDAIYALIHKDVIASASEPDTEFAINYIGAIASGDMDNSYEMTFNVATTPTMTSFPSMDGFTPAQFEFITKELRRAESAGSSRASYIIGVVLARQKKYAESIAQFGKALDMMQSGNAPEETQYTSSSFGTSAPQDPLADIELGESENAPTPMATGDNASNTQQVNYQFDYMYGEIDTEAGNFDKAVGDFTKFITATESAQAAGSSGMDYYTEDAYKKRADAYVSLGKIDLAIKDYQYLLDKAQKELESYENDKENHSYMIDSTKDKVKEYEDKIEELKGKK